MAVEESMRTATRTLRTILVAATCALPAAALAQAHNEAAPKAGGPKGGAPTLTVATTPALASPSLDDTAALGDFIDGIMKAHVEDLRIPGAVVAVVKNGKVLYAKGYGSQDIAKGIPVDPATSLFRIGSTSKLFTWTAVMQLVEQGKLDLDGDVNSYLKTFKIKDAYGKPIRIRDLMTHSAGWEDGALGYLIIEDSAGVEPIATTLEKHQPNRVRPPGALASYSNYGAALAGLIVEQVSGEPFNDYIRKHILEPLDMKYATFQEPVPDALKPYSTVGYADENGIYVAKPFEFVGGFRPAGSGSMSALSMTHFMFAHLNDGEYNGVRILKPETAQLMHRRAFSNDPRLPSMALGFYEQEFNGVRVIGHGGDTQHFHTEMYLVPDAQVGIFASYIGDGGGRAREGLVRGFFDRYFPAKVAATPAPPADLDAKAKSYVGSYRFARHSSSKFEKLILVASPALDVSYLAKDKRLVLTGLGEKPEQFEPIGGGVFQEIAGHRRIAFIGDSAGPALHMSVEDLPFMGTERVPWNESPKLWYLLLGLSTIIFLSVLITAYFRRKENSALPTEQKRAALLATITAAWFFLTFIVITLVLAMSFNTLFSHVPGSLKAALVLPIVFVLLTLLLVAALVQAWRGGFWTTGRRVRFTFVVLAAVSICIFFNTWNLLGWRFG
ncbi:MAG TPA: serine hydrolase domain-containing protein [Gemmatimonadaceae bacterium]|nr:serine hydrolase domain-containing protein [Gemmatimonadaceae bacterium]